MEQQKRNENNQATESGANNTTSNEQGRVPEQEHPSENSNDISQVDRQEGQMDHGELGGNFDTSNANTAK